MKKEYFISIKVASIIGGHIHTIEITESQYLDFCFGFQQVKRVNNGYGFSFLAKGYLEEDGKRFYNNDLVMESRFYFTPPIEIKYCEQYEDYTVTAFADWVCNGKKRDRVVDANGDVSTLDEYIKKIELPEAN